MCAVAEEYGAGLAATRSRVRIPHVAAVHQRQLYIHTFIIEWQHKHAGFKTKHNAQSISQ